MTVSDPHFWGGVAAAVITGLFGWLVQKVRHRESLEDRLQRWQTETVQRFRDENADLRTEIATLKSMAARLPIMEACLRLAVDALHQIAPESPELRQIGALLRRAIPVDHDTPHDLRELIDKLQ